MRVSAEYEAGHQHTTRVLAGLRFKKRPSPCIILCHQRLKHDFCSDFTYPQRPRHERIAMFQIRSGALLRAPKKARTRESKSSA